MSIPFTKYFDYDEKPRHINLCADLETEHKAKRLILQGCYFDIELNAGKVSLFCETADLRLAVQDCDNFLEIHQVIARLVADAEKALAEIKQDDASMILTFVPEAEHLSYDAAMDLAYERSNQLAKEIFEDVKDENQNLQHNGVDFSYPG